MFRFSKFASFFLSLLLFANFVQQSIKAEGEFVCVNEYKHKFSTRYAKIIVYGSQGSGKTTLFDSITSLVWHALISPEASARNRAIDFVSKSHTQQFGYSSGFGQYIFKNKSEKTELVSTLAFDTTSEYRDDLKKTFLKDANIYIFLVDAADFVREGMDRKLEFFDNPRFVSEFEDFFNIVSDNRDERIHSILKYHSKERSLPGTDIAKFSKERYEQEIRSLKDDERKNYFRIILVLTKLNRVETDYENANLREIIKNRVSSLVNSPRFYNIIGFYNFSLPHFDDKEYAVYAVTMREEIKKLIAKALQEIGFDRLSKNLDGMMLRIEPEYFVDVVSKTEYEPIAGLEQEEVTVDGEKVKVWKCVEKKQIEQQIKCKGVRAVRF